MEPTEITFDMLLQMIGELHVQISILQKRLASFTSEVERERKTNVNGTDHTVAEPTSTLHTSIEGSTGGQVDWRELR